MKKLICIVLLCAMTACIFAGCANKTDKAPVEGKKVAYIINMPASAIFEDCAAQCKNISEKLGMSCDVFFSGGSDDKFKADIQSCVDAGYDGLYLSHGGESYSYELINDLLSEHKELKIVTFDTQFTDASGGAQKIDGVTQFFQDDAGLAESLLDYICTELVPDKKPAKILKVWVGDYIAAFDRREVGYQKYVDNGKIATVETIAPADFGNATESMYEVMKAALEKYDEGDIDAVWVAYDAYAQGCYRAIKESGKNIPLVSVDLCDADAEYMKEENSVWKACACTDFKANGEQGIRILALELAGEYDKITDPKTKQRTDYIEMPASLITKENLPADGQTIYDVAPETYGSKEYYVTSDWLKKAIGY